MDREHNSSLAQSRAERDVLRAVRLLNEAIEAAANLHVHVEIEVADVPTSLSRRSLAHKAVAANLRAAAEP